MGIGAPWVCVVEGLLRRNRVRVESIFGGIDELDLILKLW